jgi:hypothetical protein
VLPKASLIVTMCVCMSACMPTCVFARVLVHACACMRACACVRACVRACVCVCVCTVRYETHDIVCRLQSLEGSLCSPCTLHTQSLTGFSLARPPRHTPRPADSCKARLIINLRFKIDICKPRVDVFKFAAISRQD